MINYVELVKDAKEMANNHFLSSSIDSLGVWNDGGENIFQVQVTVRDSGGSDTRFMKHYYYVPCVDPQDAVDIARARALHEFLNIEIPLVVETQVKKSKGVKEDEPAVSEESKAENDSSEEVRPEVAEDKEQRQPKKKRGSKSVKEVGEKYDNNKASHKDTLISFLDKEHEGWRDLGKEKTKAMSQSLVGISFLNDNGEIVESFKDAIKKHI